MENYTSSNISLLITMTFVLLVLTSKTIFLNYFITTLSNKNCNSCVVSANMKVSSSYLKLFIRSSFNSIPAFVYSRASWIVVFDYMLNIKSDNIHPWDTSLKIYTSSVLSKLSLMDAVWFQYKSLIMRLIIFQNFHHFVVLNFIIDFW